MARIRSIKPDFWTDEKVVNVDVATRLFFVGIWSFCDDGGVHPARPRVLKMRIFPGDEYSEADIKTMLENLEKSGLITLFTCDLGDEYLFVNNWFQDQKVEKPNKKYPQFADHSPTIRRPFADHSTTESSSIVVGNGVGNGKEGSSHAPAHEEGFSEEPKNNPTLSAIPGGAAAAVKEFDDCHGKILAYLRPNNWQRLTTIAAAQHYDPAKYGPLSEEVAAFVRHNLGDAKKRSAAILDPVAHFERHFPTWLKNAKQFNRAPGTASPDRRNRAPSEPKPKNIEAALAVVKARHGEFADELTREDVQMVLSNTNTFDQFTEAIKSRLSRIISKPNYTRTGPISLSG